MITIFRFFNVGLLTVYMKMTVLKVRLDEEEDGGSYNIAIRTPSTEVPFNCDVTIVVSHVSFCIDQRVLGLS